MRKVAVFGNAGGGKSTLAAALAKITGLPLHVIDKVKWRTGGVAIPHDEYLKLHAGLIEQDRWIIDGFGCVASTWQRFAAADTLVYVDLPTDASLVGDQALHQESFQRPRRLAGEQPALEQHAQQLPRAVALPSRPDAEVPAARR
jgi:adenylate kinase family enzyme